MQIERHTLCQRPPGAGAGKLQHEQSVALVCDGTQPVQGAAQAGFEAGALLIVRQDQPPAGSRADQADTIPFPVGRIGRRRDPEAAFERVNDSRNTLGARGDGRYRQALDRPGKDARPAIRQPTSARFQHVVKHGAYLPVDR
jgi:hypothetical protein